MNTRVSTFLIDILTIFIFAVLARLTHSTPEDPFTFINILDIWWPFAFDVLLDTALIKSGSNPRVVSASTIVWLGTMVVGLTVQATRSSAVPHWSFVLVASVMNALLLLNWRATLDAVARRSLD